MGDTVDANETQNMQDRGRFLIGNNTPRWLLTVVLWALAGLLTFYGNVRYNEGARLATEAKMEALSQRITYNDGRVATLEQRSISRQELSDLLSRIESIDLEQKRMNDRIDTLILKLKSH
jgi:hypothetical protein